MSSTISSKNNSKINLVELERLLSATRDSNTESAATPLPRLCHMKSIETKGYGFNLKSKNDKQCQYIGRVDKNSPADLAGLKANDRIVEVNCKNVEAYDYDRLMQLIRQGVKRSGQYVKDELLLLVLDSEADAYYATRDVIIKTNGNGVKKIFLSSDINEILIYAKNKQKEKSKNQRDGDEQMSTRHDSIIIDEAKLFERYGMRDRGNAVSRPNEPDDLKTPTNAYGPNTNEFMVAKPTISRSTSRRNDRTNSSDNKRESSNSNDSISIDDTKLFDRYSYGSTHTSKKMSSRTKHVEQDDLKTPTNAYEPNINEFIINNKPSSSRKSSSASHNNSSEHFNSAGSMSSSSSSSQFKHYFGDIDFDNDEVIII